MRAVLATVLATVTLGLGYGPALAQTAGWLYSIHMFDALTGWAAEAEGGSGVFAKGAVESMVRTTDGGIHWKDVTPRVPAGQQIRRYGFEVGWLSPLSARISTAMGPQNSDPWSLPTAVLFTTVNGGETWKSATLPFGGLIDFINARDGWVLAGNDDVYRSTDGGETWIKIGNAKFFRQAVAISFLNTTSGWIAGFGNAKDGVYHLVTRDGGYTWQQQKLPLPPQVNASGSLDIGGSHRFFNSQDGILPVVYGSNQDAGVFFYVTHDGGATWTYTTPVALQSYRTASGGLIPLYRSSSFADANHGWVTDGDVLYVTSDGGRQWTTIRPGPPFARTSPVGQIDFISPQVGWAAGQAAFLPVLLKTVDGGRTWTRVVYTISRP